METGIKIHNGEIQKLYDSEQIFSITPTPYRLYIDDVKLVEYKGEYYVFDKNEKSNNMDEWRNIKNFSYTTMSSAIRFPDDSEIYNLTKIEFKVDVVPHAFNYHLVRFLKTKGVLITNDRATASKVIKKLEQKSDIPLSHRDTTKLFGLLNVDYNEFFEFIEGK